MHFPMVHNKITNISNHQNNNHYDKYKQLIIKTLQL